MPNIRNFSIIAHIDHGKSTLADRLIQHTGMVGEREFRDQLLDTMDIERERGITIKSNTITLPYKAKDGIQYDLNLIDTPGHVDFSYEVSRALASCEGVLLLVDASQGVQAQTLANLYMAMEHDLAIIPVINKIDLPSADVEMVKDQIDRELGLDPDLAILCSAKEGIGIEDVLEAVAAHIPPPTGSRDKPLSALIFDAFYDPYRGVIVSFRVFDGVLKAGDLVRFLFNNAVHKVEEVGLFGLQRQPVKELAAGMVGYLIAGIKTVADTRVGDTITLDANPSRAAAGVQRSEARGLLLPLSGGLGRIPVPGRGPGKIQTQRRRPGLYQRLFRRPGPGLPLRFSGAAAPGHRPGAPGAGIRSVPDHDHPQRPL